MSIKNISIINGISIYYSYLIRKLPKPRCNIPKILELDPSIFENVEIDNICDCKKCCKYFFPSPPNSSLSCNIPHRNIQEEIRLVIEKNPPEKKWC